MTDWFRMWHGAPTDPKWRLIARRAKVRPGDVWSVVSYLFDRASQAENRGSVEGADAELVAEVFGYEADEVARIFAELEAKAVIVGGRLAAWDKYQPKREDNSSERVKALRDRRKQQSERDVTQSNAPEESRVETEPPSLRSDGERARTANPSVVLQSVVDAMTAQAFVDHCSEKRKPLSSQQAQAIVGVLRDVRAAGGNPAEALRLAVRKGWVSLEIEYLRNSGFNLGSAQQPAPAEDWEARLAVWRESGTWHPLWGPKPNEPGCRAPAHLLRTAA